MRPWIERWGEREHGQGPCGHIGQRRRREDHDDGGDRRCPCPIRPEGRGGRFRCRPAQSRPGDGSRAPGGVRPDQRGAGRREAFAGADPRQAARDVMALAGIANPRQGRADRARRRERHQGDAQQVRLGDLRQPGRHRAWRHPRDALRRRGHHRNQSRSVVGARFRPHHRPARLQDGEGRGRRAHGEAPAPHPLRPRPRRARRHAEGRRRPGDPVDPAARHHPGERGGAARLECRLARDPQQSALRARARLSRCRSPAQRRDCGDERPVRAERPVR